MSRRTAMGGDAARGAAGTRRRRISGLGSAHLRLRGGPEPRPKSCAASPPLDLGTVPLDTLASARFLDERGKGGVKFLRRALYDGFHYVDGKRSGPESLFEGQRPQFVGRVAPQTHHNRVTDLSHWEHIGEEGVAI